MSVKKTILLLNDAQCRDLEDRLNRSINPRPALYTSDGADREGTEPPAANLPDPFPNGEPTTTELMPPGLAALEMEIREGIAGYERAESEANAYALRAGRGLAAVFDGKLYESQGFKRLDDYAEARFGLGKSQAYRWKDYALFHDAMVKRGLPAPPTEGLYRSLTTLPADEREDAWRDACTGCDPITDAPQFVVPTPGRLREVAGRRKPAAGPREAAGEPVADPPTDGPAGPDPYAVALDAARDAIRRAYREGVGADGRPCEEIRDAIRDILAEVHATYRRDREGAADTDEEMS